MADTDELVLSSLEGSEDEESFSLSGIEIEVGWFLSGICGSEAVNDGRSFGGVDDWSFD